MEQADSWQPHLSRFSIYSLLLLFVAGMSHVLPKITSSIGTWLVPATILLEVWGALIGYVFSFGGEPAQRKG